MAADEDDDGAVVGDLESGEVYGVIIGEVGQADGLEVGCRRCVDVAYAAFVFDPRDALGRAGGDEIVGERGR